MKVLMGKSIFILFLAISQIAVAHSRIDFDLVLEGAGDPGIVRIVDSDGYHRILACREANAALNENDLSQCRLLGEGAFTASELHFFAKAMRGTAIHKTVTAALVGAGAGLASTVVAVPITGVALGMGQAVGVAAWGGGLVDVTLTQALALSAGTAGLLGGGSALNLVVKSNEVRSKWEVSNALLRADTRTSGSGGALIRQGFVANYASILDKELKRFARGEYFDSYHDSYHQ